MSDALLSAVRAIWDDPDGGVMGLYRSEDAAPPVAVRAAFLNPTDPARLSGVAPVLASSTTVRVLTQDIGDKPSKKASFEVSGRRYRVAEVEQDARGLWWDITLTTQSDAASGATSNG
ncbi:Hypothetical protein GbCGDNIH3_7061 [Granulibacter bethesdensis]|uniref:Uncharacterized protein n=1 Tax=Granulibacter bethesdensis TaxID=364410 RepID=A0AAN0VFX8_9PROT|nr:hypothetical protein [Granulibacter bethesdensis]AHJ63247.1 Hypothetical protein GbCGDNIH3_7061 [Granulibacter bethesdensis]